MEIEKIEIMLALLSTLFRDFTWLSMFREGVVQRENWQV